MAYRCAVCGKGPRVANLVSHSNRKTKRRQLPNLQRAKIEIKGVVKTVKICTKCLKSGKIKKAG